jgi:predicted metal-binding membrane protein
LKDEGPVSRFVAKLAGKPMHRNSTLEHLLHRDRLIVAIGTAAVAALAWAYLAGGAGMDTDMMAEMPDMAPMPWTPVSAALLFVMWWVMMIAMMVPSAAPTVLLYAAVKRGKDDASGPVLEGWMFLSGYLLIWAGFSLMAVLAQGVLEHFGLLSMAMASTSRALGGIILLAAGLYQFTPLKRACLRYCQSPLLFLSSFWRAGAAGALRMGTRHGTYCVGCCWFLMALLFVSGVMNFVWIIGIALYVASEKLLPFGDKLSHVAGVALIMSGAFLLARAA